MKVVVITFFIWAGLGYPVYRFIGPGALVAYGVLPLACLLIWASTRKK